jgi:hypothetical protein
MAEEFLHLMTTAITTVRRFLLLLALRRCLYLRVWYLVVLRQTPQTQGASRFRPWQRPL